MILPKIINKYDLRGANLSEANLRRADLSYANLRRADLSRANLSYANLNEALLDIPVIFIYGSKYTLQNIGNEIRIGCEVHTIDHWLKYGKDIEIKNRCTEKEMEEYRKYILKCKGE